MLREGEIRIPSGCAISGVISKSGKNINGSEMIKSIATMHDRSNGLGGGFAGYGIYPQYPDLYAFHVFYDGNKAREECERFLDKHFDIINLSKIPVRKSDKIVAEPLIWRYFVEPLKTKLKDSKLDEKEFVSQCVIHINSNIEGAYVFSCGKNMGIFKALGYPEEVGEYFRLDEYEGYAWTAHGRYPTNTPGWWGGAHPFTLLDVSVVHNGEISSYDANRRCMEMYGYTCTLMTDTEVIAYMIDYLVRKQGLTYSEAANVLAAPFWSTIEHMPEEEKRRMLLLRQRFPSMLINGPFSILVGFTGGMMALNDRLKLRSMVVAETEDMAYVASEECAIRRIAPDVTNVWAPRGGQPVIFTTEGGRA